MTARYNTQEAATLLGVAPSTVRSWVHRGHLRPGRMVRGTMTWTSGQLQAAKAREVEPSTAAGGAILDPSDARCSCGNPPRMTESDGWAVLSCCGSMAVRLRQVTPEPRYDTQAHPAVIERAIQSMMWKAADERRGQPSVYFVRLGIYVKIGTSTDVRRRVRSLSLNRENLLAVLPGGQEQEKALHARFADLRAWGEWFNYRGELAAYVEELRAEQMDAKYPDTPRLSA